MVLRGFLEDFLDGAGRTGGEDDAAAGDVQEGILAHAVDEELGDVRGEGCGGLMAVEPGRDAETAVFHLRIPGADGKGGAEPAGIPERRGRGEHRERIVELLPAPARHPGAEMRRLHGPGAAARSEQLALFGQRPGNLRHLAERGVRAEQRMAAHDGNDLARIETAEEVFHRVADPVVMQGAAEGLPDVVTVLPPGDIILVNG